MAESDHAANRLIRLLYLIPTLDRCGTEKQLTLLASRLPRDRFQPCVCALTRGGPYAADLQRAGVPVTVLHKRLKLDPWTLWRLNRLLRDGRFHIVHTWLFAANSYGRLLAHRHRVPIVVVSERCADLWKGPIEHTVDRWLLPYADRFVVNSQGVSAYYLQRGVPAERMVVIPNGLVLEPPPAVDRAAVRAELDVPADGFVIGFVGRLWPQKRVADLIWATELLRNLYDVYTLIAGDGPDRPALENMVDALRLGRRIRLLGARHDVPRLLAAMDAFVLPSRFEGMPNAVLEAMWAGLPVVATNIAGNNELVVTGQTGYLVPVGDTTELARRLRLLIENERLRKRMGQAGRQRVREHFGVDRMVGQHLELYEQLLREKGLGASG